MSRTRITASKFKRIYDPSAGEDGPWYINDHCFVRGGDGRWHLFGITHAEPAAPLDEKCFAHASTADLPGPWEKHPHVMHADRDAFGETHVWAPHIICHGGRYHMFYCAGGDDHARYRIHLATSDDLWQWTRHPGNPLIVDGFDARDPMVLRVDDEWLMYYTATRPAAGGRHVVVAVRSEDLVHWRDPVVVFKSDKAGTFGGPTESPFVFEHGSRFYLSLCLGEPYACTAFYESDNPMRFGPADEVGRIVSHAAEVITLPDGTYKVSHAGWGQGGVYLADLFVGGHQGDVSVSGTLI